jgi:8-oxo-dGTP pyrophosphatase MutT (NUDIX family)
MVNIKHHSNKNTFPTDFWEDTQNSLSFIMTGNPPRKIRATAVKCILIRKGRILLTKIPRGWDIPTGHIEDGESPGEAIVREVFEETGAVLQSFHLLGYLRSVKLRENEKNMKYPKISAIPIYVADKFVVRRKFEKLNEVTDRNFFKINRDGSINSQNWSLLMKAIFSRAISEMRTT